MKAVKKIKEIDKITAHKLHNDFGVPFCKYEGISTSKTKRRKYYLCESKENMSFLRQVKK